MWDYNFYHRPCTGQGLGPLLTSSYIFQNMGLGLGPGAGPGLGPGPRTGQGVVIRNKHHKTCIDNLFFNLKL